MKKIIFLFIIMFSIQTLQLTAKNRLRFNTSLSSSVNQYKNEKTSFSFDSGYSNSAKGNSLHLILNNSLGLGYTKSEVTSDADAGGKLTLESNTYNISFLLGDDDLNYQLGLNITGETKVSELSASGVDFSGFYDYDTDICRNYFLNFGTNINESVELLFGFSSWEVATDVNFNGLNLAKYSSNYNLYNVGIGILF